MNLSFINEFTYFSNDEAIDRVVTKEGVRFVKLKDDEKPYGLNELLANISSNMYIVSDVHIGDPIDNWEDKRNKIISTINNIVGKNDKLLFLGDLTAHSNTTNIYDVVNFIKCLNCENLYLILGNNDIYSIDSYKRMGFKAVVDKVIWRNYIFTHMPIPVTGKEINIHGHLHEEIRYENVDWHNHIRIWDDEYKPITFREVLTRFESGYYKGVTMTSDELKAEWEAKQKIEEIETNINSVFDEIEKLSENYNIPDYVQNVYSGNLTIGNKILLYEIHGGTLGSNTVSRLITYSDSFNPCTSLETMNQMYKKSCKCENHYMLDRYLKFDDMLSEITNVLESHSTDDVQFIIENVDDDYKVYADIQFDVCEKITILTDKRVHKYDISNGKLTSTEVIIVSQTYMNSIMRGLFTYDPVLDCDLLLHPKDVVSTYDAYINNKIYDFIKIPEKSGFNRRIDLAIYDSMTKMALANKTNDEIVNSIRNDFFSDYKSKDEVLTNARYRLENFVYSLKALKMALSFNALSADKEVQNLINLKSPDERYARIKKDYEQFVPQLQPRQPVLKLSNGGTIIISLSLYAEITDKDHTRDDHLSYLINPIWYALNGYDIVIYGHGLTESEFHKAFDEDYGHITAKYKSHDDFYTDLFIYDNQVFGTLNSLLLYLNKKWVNKDKPCKIMVLACNENPEVSTPKLVNQFSDPKCPTIDVSVSYSKVLIETTISELDDVQDVYNEVVEYCDGLTQDLSEIETAMRNRFQILEKFNIKNFYIQAGIITNDATYDCITYRNYKDFMNDTFKRYRELFNEIEKVIRFIYCYLSCISNYIRYTGKLLDERKVAFTGVRLKSNNKLIVNEYSGCLIDESVDVSDYDLSNQKYIYVCTFKYKSLFGTIVRAATLSNYNHAAISLNEHLSPMYTYVRENPRVESRYNNKNGFSHEFLSDMLQKDPDSIVKVIAIPVTDEQYETAEALIKGYEENIEDTSYDFGNIVASFFKVKRNVYNLPEMDMVCSEFVAYILYSIGFRGMSKSVNLTTPKDISQLDKKFIGAKCIYEGKVKDYKK